MYRHYKEIRYKDFHLRPSFCLEQIPEITYYNGSCL